MSVGGVKESLANSYGRGGRSSSPASTLGSAPHAATTTSSSFEGERVPKAPHQPESKTASASTSAPASPSLSPTKAHERRFISNLQLLLVFMQETQAALAMLSARAPNGGEGAPSPMAAPHPDQVMRVLSELSLRFRGDPRLKNRLLLLEVLSELMGVLAPAGIQLKLTGSSGTWHRDLHRGLFHLMRNRLSSHHRYLALQLAGIMLERMGPRWAMLFPGDLARLRAHPNADAPLDVVTRPSMSAHRSADGADPNSSLPAAAAAAVASVAGEAEAEAKQAGARVDKTSASKSTSKKASSSRSRIVTSSRFSSTTFVELVVKLASIEVRMLVDFEPKPRLPPKKARVLIACYQILERSISLLVEPGALTGEGEENAESTKASREMIRRMRVCYREVFGSILRYLRYLRGQESADMLLVRASVRVAGSWLAEESEEHRDLLYEVLPFLLQLAGDESAQHHHSLLDHLLPGLFHVVAAVDGRGQRCVVEGGGVSVLSGRLRALLDEMGGGSSSSASSSSSSSSSSAASQACVHNSASAERAFVLTADCLVEVFLLDTGTPHQNFSASALVLDLYAGVTRLMTPSSLVMVTAVALLLLLLRYTTPLNKHKAREFLKVNDRLPQIFSLVATVLKRECSAPPTSSSSPSSFSFSSSSSSSSQSAGVSGGGSARGWLERKEMWFVGTTAYALTMPIHPRFTLSALFSTGWLAHILTRLLSNRKHTQFLQASARDQIDHEEKIAFEKVVLAAMSTLADPSLAAEFHVEVYHLRSKLDAVAALLAEKRV
jgi:Neurochondrin